MEPQLTDACKRLAATRRRQNRSNDWHMNAFLKFNLMVSADGWT
jgi:hypothetical protein